MYLALSGPRQGHLAYLRATALVTRQNALYRAFFSRFSLPNGTKVLLGGRFDIDRSNLERL